MLSDLVDLDLPNASHDNFVDVDLVTPRRASPNLHSVPWDSLLLPYFRDPTSYKFKVLLSKVLRP